MSFDVSKAMADGGRCRTRSGFPARVICADRQSNDGRMLVALVMHEAYGGGEGPWMYYADGHYARGQELSEWDLLNEPRRRTVWINVYTDQVHTHHPSRSEADKYALDGRIACLGPIEFEEGEGL